MINLGDVTFSLGADVANLLRSIDVLNRFSARVTATQNVTDRASAVTAAAFRRQEKAAGDAFNAMQKINSQMGRMEGTQTFVRRNEQAFARLNQTLSNGQLTALQFQRAQEQFRRSLANTTENFRTFRDTANGVIPALQNIASGAVLVSGPLGGVATRIVSLTAVMERGGFEAAAFVAGIGTATYGLIRFGQVVLDVGKQVKGFEGQFQAVTGTVAGGWLGMAKAIEIARNTGARIEDLAGGMARFRAASEGTGMAAKDVDKAFRTVAAATTKLQLGSEQTAGIFKALEQMMSKGTVQAEELRGQLGDRLPGAVQIAARAMGVTTRELQDLMKKGLVPTRKFLPKFAAELAKTFRIDANPVKNLTASLNNMHNAWFQLIAAIDQAFKITDNYQIAVEKLTAAFDWMRENLGALKLGVTAIVGAFAGLAAPAILGGIISMAGWIVRMGASVGSLNRLLIALPFGIFIRGALAVAGAVTALSKYGDEIIVVQGQMGTLQDYAEVVWNDIKNFVQTAVGDITAFFENMVTPWESVNNFLKDISSKSWGEIAADTLTIVNAVVTEVYVAFSNLGIAISAVFGNIMSEFQGIMGAANSVRRFFSPWIDDFNHKDPEGKTGFAIYENWLANQKYEKTSFEDILSKMDRNRIQQTAFMTQKSGDYLKNLQQVANDNAKTRQLSNFRQSELQTWGQKFDGFQKSTGGIANDNSPMSEKERKKAERMQSTLQRMNEEINRTKEEITALGGTQATLDSLTEKFKRQDEVRKYADAMLKAGHAADFVKQKSAELMTALELRDKLANQREALTEWRDALVNAFDQVASTLVDAMFEGGDAMQALKDVARDVARDIFNTFLQLSLLNPLKNMLFGTNLPVMGGLFGGGGVDPWAGMRTMRNGGISETPFMRYARNGLLNHPTMMMTSSGPVTGGEAGAEAIVPLTKNSSGKYGIEANGLGGKSNVIHAVFSPTYNVTGVSEQMEELKAQMAAQEATFEARVTHAVKLAQNQNKF